MLNIYGSIQSTCTTRVFVSLLALGLKENKDFKLHNVTELQEIRTKKWIEKQPFSQMPYAVDDESGQVLFESRAIARYAARKYAPGSPYFPKDLEGFAKFEIGASVETANFDPIVKDLSIRPPGISKCKHGKEIDQGKVDELEEKLKHKLEGYERLLAKQQWVGGDRPTLVDLFHIPFPNVLLSIGVCKALVDGSFPLVAGWWNRLTELDAWKEFTEIKREFVATQGQ